MFSETSKRHVVVSDDDESAPVNELIADIFGESDDDDDDNAEKNKEHVCFSFVEPHVVLGNVATRGLGRR